MPKAIKQPERPERPKLVNRPRCLTYNPKGGCWDCGNKTFRYYAQMKGKKYYQCEKCRAGQIYQSLNGCSAGYF